MQNHIKNLGYYLMIFLLAFGMKYHYSRADSEQLVWILAPTAGMVTMLSGLPFEREFGEGYINYEQALIIAPSCAGVNFLIAAFCMAGFSFLHLFESRRGRLLWLSLSLLVSYLLTIFINSIRILLGIRLYQANIVSAWLSPGQAHRLEGIVIYFSFLSLYYLLLDAIVTYIIRGNWSNVDSRLRRNDTAGRTGNTVIPAKAGIHRHWSEVNTFSPLFWYLCIAVLVPFVHQMYRRELQLSFEHALSVIASCSAIFFFLNAVKIYRRKLLKVDKVERIP